MADTDKSLYNLRYNQITSNLEAFGGGSPQWTLITLNNVDPQQVPVTRQINTTTPLQGGGNLTVDRTLSILQATNISDGYLSSTDWNTFNNKQPAGSYITALTGDGTASGPGSVPLVLATVNGNVGTFSYASITVNGKGLITSASNGITGSLTDVGTDGIVVTGGTGAVIGAGTSLSQHVADATHNGYLLSTDWSTFNGKQAAGNYITALTGDVTATGPGSVAATLATVNGNVGSFTNASITVNGKGLITAASSGTALVTSVSGTANQISSTGGTTPVLSLSSTLQLPGTLQLGGDENANSHKITNLTNGSAAQDAAAFGQIPVITAGQIVGTNTNNNATAGNVGEYVDSTTSLAAGGTSATDTNLTSISLTAGDWDVSALIFLSESGSGTGAVVSFFAMSISTTSATQGTLGDNAVRITRTGSSDEMFLTQPRVRISIASTTTVYLVYSMTYTGATPRLAGNIRARRMR